MESKDKAMEVVASLYNGIKEENVDNLIKTFEVARVDTRYTTPIVEFVRELMLNKIQENVNKSKNHVFRVKRHSEYGGETFDFYRIEDGILIRNGSDAKYTSIGKLYQAYQQAKK